MTNDSHHNAYPKDKYSAYLSRFKVELPDRDWPSRIISKAPRWCSVDLRDGNQALVNPMNMQQKLRMFRLLVDIGFKEIEIGFPSAAQVEYGFARTLIEDQILPADVTPQVLTQARPHLIRRTFEALKGAPRAVLHLYNSTSEVQRRIVFKKSKDEIIELATAGTRLVRDLAKDTDTDIVFEYSPESFTGTELEFAKDVCEAVMDVWQPSPDQPMIINLPATVEMSTPNVYADQIEWFIKKVSGRDRYILSLHTHNDRGTGVAATELGLLAGADRVEGTLFGNGERTGNLDIVTCALNLYSQGIDPQLNFRELERIREIAEECTQIPVHQRHPYAGELVFTAFSGSHQDAINKGMQVRQDRPLWEVPYIPIDPADIGRRYEQIVRINSQSGKGGVAYILKAEFGIDLPREIHAEFADVVQALCDHTGKEVLPATIWEAFSREYLFENGKFRLESVAALLSDQSPGSQVQYNIKVVVNGVEHNILVNSGSILLALDEFCASTEIGEVKINQVGAASTIVEKGTRQIFSFVEVANKNGDRAFGIGKGQDLDVAAVRAIFSALNRMESAEVRVLGSASNDGFSQK